MAIKPLHNESRLLAKVARGEQHAFCALFDHYRKYVFSFGRKLTRSDVIAEEIVQDIFLKLWYGRDKLDGIDNFGAYLNILVRNHAFNLLRSMAQQQKTNQEMRLSASNYDNSTQHVLDYRETVRILDEALELLPEQQRLVYTLCHREGLKYEEAALQMNISTATVHYHMKLALSAIRKHFAKNAIAYPIVLLWLLK